MAPPPPKRSLISASTLAALLITATIHPLAQLPAVVAADSPTHNTSLYGVVTVWNMVPHPASLEGSLVGLHTTTTRFSSETFPMTIMSYRLDCAAASSPDNDACRAASLYPVDVVMGGGEMGTVTASGTTTMWSCHIADDAYPGAPLTASCVNTLVASASRKGSPPTTTTVTTTMDECGVNARMVLANITAGWDKMALKDLPEMVRNGDKNASASVSEWSSHMSQDLSTHGCSPPLRLANPTAAATGTGSKPTTGLSATAGQATPTAKSPNSGARRHMDARAVFGGVFAALFAGSLAVVLL